MVESNFKSVAWLIIMLTITKSAHSSNFISASHKIAEPNDAIITYDNQSIDHFQDTSFKRKGKFFETFPFYTLGRFQRQLCSGVNNLMGTCMVKGECIDTGGIVSANCTGLTMNNQAICCVYQFGCESSSSLNNTYFFNPNYPDTYSGGSTCSYSVSRGDSDTCQLRIDLLDFQLAQPSGEGFCTTDYMSVTGGNSQVPRICGDNTGQHIYVNFNEDTPIVIRFYSSSGVAFKRRWYIRTSQINCDGAYRAPSGCLQYYLDNSGTVKSLNYGSGENNNLNQIGVEGSRQLANTIYGVCVRTGASACSITWSEASGDIYGFTVTDDVGSVDPSLLGTAVVQSQQCTTDYVIIPNPIQNNVALQSDRFCGLGLSSVTSNAIPFVLYHVTDGNETPDIGNRGFYLSYSQNECPVP